MVIAHYLIDDCGIDLIHGHSSHHIQGVETYKGKLIIYGCGDFVDDYALTPTYRNDLSAVWYVLRSLCGLPLPLSPINSPLSETHCPEKHAD